MFHMEKRSRNMLIIIVIIIIIILVTVGGDFSLGVNMGSDSIPQKTLSNESIK